jgi:hypothetical protein|uniref:Uncharacterized protein n=1 Tax=Populus trichocarpa TaxID=3694 RepID=A0A2K1XEN0_POPTR
MVKQKESMLDQDQRPKTDAFSNHQSPLTRNWTTWDTSKEFYFLFLKKRERMLRMRI